MTRSVVIDGDGRYWWSIPAWMSDEGMRLLGTDMSGGDNYLKIPTAAGEYVYIHRGRNDEALYVGMTSNPLTRVANHIQNKRRSPWFGSVVTIDWIRCTEGNARNLEECLIGLLQPPHNRQWTEQPRVAAARQVAPIEHRDVALLAAAGRSNPQHLTDILDALAAAA